ncbi:MAG: hypothetical protein ACRCV9_04075 [Burkholderiaceae bacterium]
MKTISAAAAMLMVCATANANWQYSTRTYQLDDKPTHAALIQSNNSLHLTFPYAGQNFGTLMVITRGRQFQVALRVDKGQLMCNGPSGCSLEARFDEQPPIKLRGGPAADQSSNTTFFSDSAVFIRRARKASRIRIEVTLFQNGSHVLDLQSVKPLEPWPAPSPKLRK